MKTTSPSARDLAPAPKKRGVVIHIKRLIGDQETEEILRWPEDVEVVIRPRRKRAA